MPISKTFYISEESLVLGDETDDTIEERKEREEEPAIPSDWSHGILPGVIRLPGSTIRSSAKSRNYQSDEESLTGTGRSQHRSIIKYPLPSPWSPHLAENRKLWIKMLVVFFVLLVTTIMGTMSIYWGGDHSIQYNIPVLTIAVIDFDHSEVGGYLQDMTTAARAKDYDHSLGFVNQDGDTLYGNLDNVHAALHDQRFWVGIVVMENATKAMNHAYEVGDEAYDPKSAIHVLYEEARNALVIGGVVYPRLLEFLDEFVLEFTKQKQENFLQGANRSNVTALQRQVQSPVAVGFTVFNVRDRFITSPSSMAPAIPSTAEAATEIGTISGYPIYWMLSWVSMTAFGLTIENFNNILGMPFTPVFFVFWVISNVTTGFYPTEILSNFYKWGIVWPLRHDIMGARAIIYGTKNNLRQNFGVLMGWVLISLLLLPGTVWVQMRKKRVMIEEKNRVVLERVWGAPGKEKGGKLKMPSLNPLR
ncbi:hypothetical protein NHQ30_000535 [Ciborinia camelliae]|nr:hypothetical protein NHQ30_000535 [Ciborinia camelliae]